MCDTIIASPSSTAEHIMLFGKNSDRERNEAQTVELLPRMYYAPDTHVTCTYLTIPQARSTNAILLCRPFWIWGAEMGANEHGVVIGNEGLSARSPASPIEALTGMDLVRLALERAATAAEAVDVITSLLEEYGQGGNCGHMTPTYYNNGFMIADRAESFVLETVGREWLVSRVGGVHAISNAYSIGQEAERKSSGLDALILNSGWWGSERSGYADAIANREKEHIGQAHERRTRSTEFLSSRKGELRAADMMSLLRDHVFVDQSETRWSPRTAVRHGLCIHAATDRQRAQTTGAMVSELGAASIHWITGTSATCISIFKPMFVDVPMPAHGLNPTDRFDAETLWWRHERMHRTALLCDFSEFLRSIRVERDALEADFRDRISSVLNGGSNIDRGRVVARCWEEAIAAEDRWFARMSITPLSGDSEYSAAWQEMDRIAGLDLTVINQRRP